MSTKYTPGPWAVSKNQDYVFGRQQGAGLEPLGFVYGPFCPEASEVGRRALADCRLIAAAPELLEALCALVLNIDAGGATMGAMADARAAIAKATGEAQS